MPTAYPNHALRAVALHTQRLTTPNGSEPEPTRDLIHETVEALGCVQIDTLAMAARAQYLTMWARLGTYDVNDFDALLNDDDDRRLFEYWAHAACLIPLAYYRYYRPVMEARLIDSNYWKKQLRKKGVQAAVDEVLGVIEEEGAKRSADFKADGRKHGSWWDWKPAKMALEYHFNRGNLMVRRRENFQRVYDLADRVLPGWVNREAATPEEAHRWRVEMAVKHAGVGTDDHIAAFAYNYVTKIRPTLRELVARGSVIPIHGTHADGTIGEGWFVHRDNLPLLDRAAEGKVEMGRTTFLCPFDSLIWSRERIRLLFGFRFVLEMYRKKEDREFGYYSMPILNRDRIVGRFDPKLDRKTGTLYLRSLWLEPTAAPDDALIADVAVAMRDFMRFHEAETLVIEGSNPPEFGEMLSAAV